MQLYPEPVFIVSGSFQGNPLLLHVKIYLLVECHSHWGGRVLCQVWENSSDDIIVMPSGCAWRLQKYNRKPVLKTGGVVFKKTSAGREGKTKRSWWVTSWDVGFCVFEVWPYSEDQSVRIFQLLILRPDNSFLMSLANLSCLLKCKFMNCPFKNIYLYAWWIIL